jgi:magnesium-protoporphyrin IX monomethyl ester (oxidative) cyclase
MNILLINPPTPDCMPNKEFILPISLLSLAAVLRASGFEVRIEDLNVHRLWETPEDAKTDRLIAVLTEALDACAPGLVGIGCLFSGQFPSVLQISEIVKRVQPEAVIVIGGMHPTLYARDILVHCPSIDYAVIGEGEEQILALARGLERRSAGWNDLDGFAFRDNGRVVVHPKRAFIEKLDDLPLPAYDLIDFHAYHHDTSHWHNPRGLPFSMTVPLISSRSCPMRCNFCSMFLVMGPKLRVRSPVHVVDEMEMLYHAYGQRHFTFMDDNLNLSKRHILSLCGEIRRRKLDILFETPNGLMVSALDREVMDAMAAAGWVRGAIAIESGSDYIRNHIMGKRLSREKIVEVSKLAKSYPDLYLKAYFIIGMPEDTPETLQATYDMIVEIDVDEPYVTNLLPFPGTRVFEQALRDRLFVEELDLSNLWRTTGFHYTDNKRFYLKPYRMRLRQLQDYREKFDRLLFSIRERKRRERAHEAA